MDVPLPPRPSQRFPRFPGQGEETGMPKHKHTQETAQDMREERREGRGSPKALSLGGLAWAEGQGPIPGWRQSLEDRREGKKGRGLGVTVLQGIENPAPPEHVVPAVGCVLFQKAPGSLPGHGNHIPPFHRRILSLREGSDLPKATQVQSSMPVIERGEEVETGTQYLRAPGSLT